MRVFDGKKEAEKILGSLKKRIKQEGVSPSLAVLIVGRNPESLVYIRNKEIAAKKIGIKLVFFKFRKNTREEKVIQTIKDLNRDTSVDGIIVQLPLPKKFDASRIINTIVPWKDVDGFCKENRELLKKGKPYFLPVLPWAIFIALRNALFNLKNKKIIALVNSDIFGQTIQLFLERKKLKSIIY
ncbi:bifunctional 5,10-methylenetetrahydrofolate dehydrogenase/5,10-methenyltetrahydrofolate cyclohydrolase [bacterium]|nr:bifunctional 5,10-methylenetetrahydrofolate dehydrogenase/5,10-methenyltetrahydrofolate cyclohydrolase [bacterium]